MLTPQYNRPAQKVQISREEELVLRGEVKIYITGNSFLFSHSAMFLKFCYYN